MPENKETIYLCTQVNLIVEGGGEGGWTEFSVQFGQTSKTQILKDLPDSLLFSKLY